MTIDVWAFNIFTSGAAPAPEDLTVETCRETYGWYLELAPKLELWGFDGVFFAEHHFNPIFIAPSPQLVVAAVAARTTTLRLGIMGSVLPMHDGRRFLEECAMLDMLTGGRFEIGIGPGAGDDEAVQSGLPAEQIRPRYYSAADLLEKGTAGPYVTHRDQFYDLVDVPIVPRLQSNPARPVWTTIMSPGSAEWAARRGWRVCTGWLPRPMAAQIAESYRAAAREVGTASGPEMLALRRRVFVAPTDVEARELAAAAADLTQLGVSRQGERQGEAADPNVAAMLAHPDDYLIGAPDTVAEQIVEQCREGGFGTFAAWCDYAAFTRDDVSRSYELIGTQVAPVVRSATLEQASV
jgi:alkanesulfonate monooxygenase SsuD/methylene tetrahydromethanopterin reductase-like flavin-dependent oxidoreductase (luciferase family)